VEGHEGIIDSLQNLSNKLQGPEVVNTLAKETSIIMGQNTPVGTRGATRGQLQRAMSETAGPKPTEGGWWAGVGSLEGIYPLESAPRNTIKEFLRMIRGDPKGGPPRKKSFEPEKAWWFLKEEEREQLREMRESGVVAVGGVSPYKPKYWFIQEKGKEEVGVTGQGYIKATIDAIRARIGQVVTNVLVSRGPVITGYNQ